MSSFNTSSGRTRPARSSKGAMMDGFQYDQGGQQEWSPSESYGGNPPPMPNTPNPFEQTAPVAQSYGGQGAGQQGGYGGAQGNSYQQQPKPAYQGGGNNGGYQKKPWTPGGNGGNYNGGGGKAPFQRKVWTPEELASAKLYKSVVITGNDSPPPMVQQVLQRLVPELEKRNYVIRSGGMKGMENLVEELARNLEVHLPWKGFDGKDSKFTYTTDEAKEFAKRYHPAYEQAKPVVQTFCAKNVRLMLGKDLKSPTQMLIIWSEDGAEHARERTAKTGLTGVAVSIATEIRIPVFNLQRPDAEQRIMAYLNQG